MNGTISTTDQRSGVHFLPSRSAGLLLNLPSQPWLQLRPLRPLAYCQPLSVNELRKATEIYLPPPPVIPSIVLCPLPRLALRPNATPHCPKTRPRIPSTYPTRIPTPMPRFPLYCLLLLVRHGHDASLHHLETCPLWNYRTIPTRMLSLLNKLQRHL